MSIFRRTPPADAALSPEPPESISAADWEKLKSGTLVEIPEFNGQAASAEKLAKALETNTTLVSIGTHLHSSNADETLSNAIVKSRNPNVVETTVDGIGGASEIILPVDYPLAVKRLFTLRDYNHAQAETLLDKLVAGAAALSDDEAVQIALRKPAITFIARRKRHMSDEEISALFEKSPPVPPIDPHAKPPFDPGLESALSQLAEPPVPSKLKQFAQGAQFVGLMVAGSAIAIAKEARDNRRARIERERQKNSSPGQNERS